MYDFFLSNVCRDFTTYFYFTLVVFNFLGKSLLETNSHLEEIIEKLHVDLDKLAEEHEQFKYSTGLKIEVQND